ncbi:hypothetical protein PVOR_04508 [Paenibacillus vortex V453]|uniref:Uncharacterized protein n=1 Tax=Paenibacillus vortex V453 TaxID=715225 RepID=A0A2R9T047_9BACL|nr:hypothetical protein PVOR_04508 [Paenibacillus vortex V453]
MQQVGNKLYRFTKAHVIGKTGSKPISPQEGKPSEAVMLVSPKLQPSAHPGRAGSAIRFAGRAGR